MMGRVWNAYLAELTKARHRLLTFLGPILVVVAIAATMLAHPIAQDTGGNYGFVAYSVPMALNLLGLLVLLMYCATLVSSEVGRGSICATLVRPVLRHEFLAAKLLLGITYAVVLTGAASAAAWAAVLALGHLDGVSFGGEVLYTNSEMVTSYLLGMLLGLLPQFAAAAYALMVSSLTRSTGAAVSTTVGVWLVADAVKYPLHLDKLLFSSYLEMPWRIFAERCDGLDPRWFPDAAYAIGASVAAFIVFAGAATFALARRNLHT